MFHIVTRLFDGGVRMSKLVRISKRSTGVFRVGLETIGRRNTLVARLLPNAGDRAIPALFDVQLIGTSNACWVLVGHERTPEGPMNHEKLLGQTWLVESSTQTDIMAIEEKWTLAAIEASELRAQLQALQAKG